jgi:large subunit ribosomal protein L24
VAGKKKAARPLRAPRKPRKAQREVMANKRQDLHVKSGDLVEVLTGKDAGKEGRVLRVQKKKSRAVVEGANIMKKHQKPNAQHQKGGVIEMEAPIHVSNLKVIEPA